MQIWMVSASETSGPIAVLGYPDGVGELTVGQRYIMTFHCWRKRGDRAGGPRVAGETYAACKLVLSRRLNIEFRV